LPPIVANCITAQLGAAQIQSKLEVQEKKLEEQKKMGREEGKVTKLELAKEGQWIK
jgi:hypothetical protein